MLKWLWESLNCVRPLIKSNLVNLFEAGYLAKNFLPGFSKTNPVNLPNAAAAIIIHSKYFPDFDWLKAYA